MKANIIWDNTVITMQDGKIRPYLLLQVEVFPETLAGLIKQKILQVEVTLDRVTISGGDSATQSNRNTQEQRGKDEDEFISPPKYMQSDSSLPPVPEPVLKDIDTEIDLDDPNIYASSYAKKVDEMNKPKPKGRPPYKK